MAQWSGKESLDSWETSIMMLCTIAALAAQNDDEGFLPKTFRDPNNNLTWSRESNMVNITVQYLPKRYDSLFLHHFAWMDSPGTRAIETNHSLSAIQDLLDVANCDQGYRYGEVGVPRAHAKNHLERLW